MGVPEAAAGTSSANAAAAARTALCAATSTTAAPAGHLSAAGDARGGWVLGRSHPEPRQISAASRWAVSGLPVPADGTVPDYGSTATASAWFASLLSAAAAAAATAEPTASAAATAAAIRRSRAVFPVVSPGWLRMLGL